MPSEKPNWYDFPEIDWETLFHPTFAYEYFRQPLTVPSSTSTDAAATVSTPLAAAWMADAAMLAYGRSGPNEMDVLEFDSILDRVGLRGHRVGNWSPEAKSVKAIFAYGPEFAVLAFRGTRQINWVNSIVDLAAIPAHEIELPQAATLSPIERNPQEEPESNQQQRCPLVHSGFQFGFNTAWSDIRLALDSYRQSHPTSPILFTGHSLGAAFATLAVERFRGGRAALYTFGSPRVGNKEFCERVRERADLGVFRFVNNDDVMTTVPPREKSFTHTCGLMHIDANGNVEPRTESEDLLHEGIGHIFHDFEKLVRDYVQKLPPPSQLTNHAQRRYCYYLWRWARNGQVP